ncbi:hypothetical protein IWW50_003696 [Coemansia erecta]|nr:hypothetical protein IWW50_003696 [Coemansia erecta]
MGDIGFFFAEAFDLVKPTTTGIKGLGTVDAINTQTLRPEVAVAIARVNAGYDAKVDEPLKTPKRFDVIPPQSLQKELFPWLKTVLIDALRQTTNSDDAQASRRILQVLRELRVVLLQDAAFLMEIPSLAEVVKSNPLFGHPLFSSADFVAFREEMRNAIGEAGVKSMDELCTGALQWVAERKAEMPEGADTRMNPTAPILPSPSPTPVLPSNTPMEVDGERKRSRDLDDLLLPSETNGAAANTADASQLPKRHRYDQATNGSTGRIFGDATNGTVTPSPLVQTQTSPRAEPVSSITSKLLADLRSENNDLKAQLRRLEWVLSQHKAEVRSWMGKIEKSVREISLSSKSSMTPPIEQPQHYVYGANPAGRPGVPMAKAVPQRSQIVSQMSVQPHEMSPQLQRYPVGQHVPSAQSNGSSRPMGPPQAVREGMVSYERQPHMPADYRSSAPAIPSSRNPAYGSQVPPAAEYADPRFAGKYSSAPQYAASSGYEHAERSWYQKPRDSAYPPNQPPSMYGMHPHGSPY